MDAPRKSKLSIQLEEMKLKGLLNEESDNDNDDYLSDFEEEENIQIVNNKYINNEINLIKKFNVQFYFDFKENKKYVLPISIENFNVANFHIYDLIIYIVKKINNSNIIIKDNNIKYSVSLRDVEGLEEENIDFYINNYWNIYLLERLLEILLLELKSVVVNSEFLFDSSFLAWFDLGKNSFESFKLNSLLVDKSDLRLILINFFDN